MNYILNRLKEASTWQGVVLLIGVAGVKISPEQSDAIVQAAVAIVAAISIFTKAPNSPDAK